MGWWHKPTHIVNIVSTHECFLKQSLKSALATQIKTLTPAVSEILSWDTLPLGHYVRQFLLCYNNTFSIYQVYLQNLCFPVYFCSNLLAVGFLLYNS